MTNTTPQWPAVMRTDCDRRHRHDRTGQHDNLTRFTRRGNHRGGTGYSQVRLLLLYSHSSLATLIRTHTLNVDALQGAPLQVKESGIFNLGATI